MDFKCYRCNEWPCQCKDGLTLIHGDSSVIVPQLATGDCFLTNPPWGSRGVLRYTDEYIKSACVPIVDLLRHKFKRGAITPGNWCQFYYAKPDCVGAFWYENLTARYDSWGMVNSEPIFYYGHDPYKNKLPRTTSNAISPPHGLNLHPGAKPLSGWMWLLEKVSLKGETVVDAFCGSGTTLIAARELGRLAIGIEIEEKYCQVASHRLTQPQLSRRELVQ